MQAYASTHAHPPRPRPILRALALLLALATPALLHADEPRIAPLELQIQAVPARTLVIPVAVHADHGRPPDHVPIRLGRGEERSATLHRVMTTRTAGQTDWLEHPGRLWTVPASDRGAEGIPIGWVLVVEPDPAFAPPEQLRSSLADDDRTLWIDGEATRLRWVDDPAQAVLGRAGRPEAWVSPISNRHRAGTTLARMAAPEAADPRRRWRHRLLNNRLGDRARLYTDDLFDDPIIEAYARQTEAHWRHALHRLWTHRPDLATRTKRRLLALANLGDGRVVPAWPADQALLDDLLGILLDPGTDATGLERRVESLLRESPRGVAWVMDDAGTRDARTGASLATLGLVNLHDASAVCTVRRDRWAGTPELHQLDRGATMRLTIDPGPTGQDGERSIWVGIEDWDTTLAVLPAIAEVRPPGLPIGPLRAPWNMREWLNGHTPARRSAVAGLLLRVPTNQEPAASDDGGVVVRRRVETREPGTGWALYLEGKDEAATGGIVRLWVGPYRQPTQVVELDLDDDNHPDGITLRRNSQRWAAMLPVPPDAVESDGTLRFGVTFEDVQGRRWAWPRPVLPWQDEPGRAAADTSTWDPHQRQRRE